jgi:hypothetical protein
MYSKIKASYTEANTIAQCRVKMTKQFIVSAAGFSQQTHLTV